MFTQDLIRGMKKIEYSVSPSLHTGVSTDPHVCHYAKVDTFLKRIKGKGLVRGTHWLHFKVTFNGETKTYAANLDDEVQWSVRSIS